MNGFLPSTRGRSSLTESIKLIVARFVVSTEYSMPAYRERLLRIDLACRGKHVGVIFTLVAMRQRNEGINRDRGLALILQKARAGDS